MANDGLEDRPAARVKPATDLRPFFSYYGGKYRAAPKYPKPEHSTIVEPFAGSAGYAMRYPDRDVWLYDVNEKVIGTWQYLIKVSPEEILSLPDLDSDQTVHDLPLHQEARWLIGWWLNKGMTAPCNRPSQWMRNPLPGRAETYWGPGARQRIARQLDRIRHWNAEVASYAEIPDRSATWFIDPPYVGAPGRRYTFGNKTIDYADLADWCRSRSGQVMVCENDGADWLPFRHFMAAKATAGKGRTGVSVEVIWTNEQGESVPTVPATDYPWCDPSCESWPHVTHRLDAGLREQYLCPTCGKPARAIFDSTDRWESERNAWHAKHSGTDQGSDRCGADDGPVGGSGGSDPEPDPGIGAADAGPDAGFDQHGVSTGMAGPGGDDRQPAAEAAADGDADLRTGRGNDVPVRRKVPSGAGALIPVLSIASGLAAL